MAVRQQLSVALLLALAGVANALASQPSPAKLTPASHRIASQLRRRVCLAPLLAPVAGLASQPAHAASNTKKDAEAVLVKLEPLAGYIDDAKWDSVRTVLKTYVARRPRPPFAPRPRERAAASFRAAPERTSRAAPRARRRPRSRRSPIAELWNLGASKNWLRAEALAAGDPELIELSEDLSSALQLTDQYVYDNNFIYFQPGNGKLKYKEPKDQVKVAQSKLKQIIAAL